MFPLWERVVNYTSFMAPTVPSNAQSSLGSNQPFITKDLILDPIILDSIDTAKSSENVFDALLTYYLIEMFNQTSY